MMEGMARMVEWIMTAADITAEVTMMGTMGITEGKPATMGDMDGDGVPAFIPVMALAHSATIRPFTDIPRG
jgi:hypothetical protein